MTMKKTLSALLCIALIVMLALPAFAAEAGKNAGTVAGTSAALTLDGKKDAAYDKGFKVDGSLTEKDGSAGAAKITYYVTYTKTDLWIFAEVKDATLSTKLEKESEPNYKMDSIEIMLDPTNKGENTADVTPWQARVDYQGNLSARKGQKGTSLFHSKAKNGTVDFFDAKAVVVDGGFNAEYKIPMDGLTEGKKIGFNFCYNDWDATGKTRVTQTSTLKVGSWTAQSYDYFTLGAIAAPAAAPKTADMSSVALAAMAMSLAAGVVIAKSKKR